MARPAQVADDSSGDDIEMSQPTSQPTEQRQRRATSRRVKKADTPDESDDDVKRVKPEKKEESDEEKKDVKPRKRRKVEKRGSDDEEQTDEDDQDAGTDQEEAEQVDPEPEVSVVRNVPRHADGYETGAIVRIACRNFMTYDFVEFSPGPNLNMIIGPNGTGKSTIVSAIALGLGYQPKDLGRARHISEFVKDQNQDGWVEIEMKSPPKRKNLIIRRLMYKSDNSTKYLMNGKTALQQTVQAAVRALNVQVDNLCCFLPQEKVYEFAQLGPADLLKATQVCSGDKRLPEWHQTLIEQKKEWMTVNGALGLARDKLKGEEEANKRNDRDIKRYHQRKEHEFERSVLEIELPFSIYQDTKGQYDGLVAQKKEAQAEVEDAELVNAPLHARKAETKKTEKALAATNIAMQKTIDKISSDCAKARTKTAAAAKGSLGIREKLQEINQAEVQRQRNIRKYKDDIRICEEAMARHKVENVDVAPILAEIAKASADVRAHERLNDDLHNRQTDAQSAHTEAENKVTALKKKQTDLQDSERRQFEELRAKDRWTATACAWFRQHQQTLKGKVYKPVLLEVRVKNPAHQRYVEALIAYNVAKTILYHDSADYRMIMAEYESRHPTFNLTEFKPHAFGPLESYERPFGDEQLHALGFDAWAIDLIDGPDEVLRYLCAESNLHRTPVCFDRNRRIDEAAIQTPNNPFRKWLANDAVSSFAFSKYGARSLYTETNDMKPASWPKAQSNQDEIRNLQRQIEAGLEQVDDIKAQFEALDEERTQWNIELQVRKERKGHWVARKAEAEREKVAYKKAETDKSLAENSLRRQEGMPSSAEKQQQLNNQLQVTSENRVKAARDLVKKLIEQADASAQKIPNVFDIMHYGLHAIALSNEASEGDAAIKAANEKYQDLSAQVTEMKRRATTELDEAKAKLGDSDETARTEYERRREDEGLRPAAVLLELIAEVDAKLAGLQPVSQAVIEQYEARKAAIEILRRNIEAKETQERALHDKLETTKNKWEPKLAKLVDEISTKFATAFDRMGCSGAVQIAKNEDYDKWGIEILVAFRDGDPMIPLTGQRQSGGERSLSTILYLMSLSAFSTAPFSLVDEINQGMDARNERAILDQLVENVCVSGASQYFLITPKLLPHLRYHDRMKILCVNNGEWMPEAWKPQSFIKARKQQFANGR